MTDSLKVGIGKFVVSGPALAVILVVNLYFEYSIVVKDPSNPSSYLFVIVCFLMVLLYWKLTARERRKRR